MNPLPIKDPATHKVGTSTASVRNNPLRFTDPDGEQCVDGKNENGDACFTATATAKADLSPLQELLLRSLVNQLTTAVQVGQQAQHLAQSAGDWLRQPRNPVCTAGYTGIGASIGFWAGGGLGSLGLAGGPAAAVTIPGGAAGGAALGGAIGGVGGLVLCSTGSGSSGGGGQSYGGHKSSTKWANQMAKRGWTEQQIDEAIASGQQFPAPNNVNPANGATRFVHPTTGRSVVIDNVTKELLHVGGDGFKY
jgi:hypothetical protein